MRTVLVVDDDPDIRDLLRRTLEPAGYHVVTAANGWEALLAFDHAEIDAILLDVLMPGLDGAKFLSIVRRLGRGKVMLPIIIISVLTEPDVADRIGPDKVQGYIGKGNIHQVLSALDRLFGTPEPNSAN